MPISALQARIAFDVSSIRSTLGLDESLGRLREATRAQPAAQLAVGWPSRPIADHLAVSGNHGAGSTLAHLEHALEKGDRLVLGGSRTNFDNSSLSATLSSMGSANSFFSLVFSSSSDFSRFASETVNLPYLAFQLYSVASEIPCLRARSAAVAPSSCSLKNRDDCSSENLLRLIRPSFQCPDFNYRWRKVSAAVWRERRDPRLVTTAQLTFRSIADEVLRKRCLRRPVSTRRGALFNPFVHT